MRFYTNILIIKMVKLNSFQWRRNNKIRTIQTATLQKINLITFTIATLQAKQRRYTKNC